MTKLCKGDWNYCKWMQLQEHADAVFTKSGYTCSWCYSRLNPLLVICKWNLIFKCTLSLIPYNSTAAYGGKLQGYRHLYLGITMKQLWASGYGRLTPFPRRFGGPQESSKRFTEEKNIFPTQESNLVISVQSIASPQRFASGTVYCGGQPR
jgi:hypothetical protein